MVFVRKGAGLPYDRGELRQGLRADLDSRAYSKREPVSLAEEVTMPYGPVGRVLGAFGRSSSEGHVKEILAKLKALAEATV